MANCLYCGKPIRFNKLKASQIRHTKCARLYNLEYQKRYYKENIKNVSE